jgi:hypothetical protein
MDGRGNEVVSPRLGLPDMPVVDFPESDDELVPGLNWKTMCLARWAAGRSFIWIDDEAADADRHLGSHHPGKALVHRVEPLIGLTDADFSSIRRWLAAQEPT